MIGILKRQTAVAVLVLAVVVGGFATGAAANSHSQKIVTLTIINSSAQLPDPVFSQLYLASTRGYLAKQGIAINVKSVGTALVAAEMASGQGDLAVSSAAVPFALTHEGNRSVALYNVLGGGVSSAMISTHAQITKISQCHTVATTSVASGGFTWAETIQKLLHTTWTLTTFGSSVALNAAVAAGGFDCEIQAYTTVNPLVLSGTAHYIYFDPSNQKARPKGWPTGNMETALWGTSSGLAHIGKATLVKFMKAFIAAGHDEQKLTPAQIIASINTFPGADHLQTPTVMAASAALVKPFVDPNDGYISKSDWDVTRKYFRGGGLGYMTATNPTWSYQNNVDMSYYLAAGGKPPTTK